MACAQAAHDTGGKGPKGRSPIPSWMPGKHRNKDAWQYLHRDHDVAGRHPPVPPNRLGAGEDDFTTPLPN